MLIGRQGTFILKQPFNKYAVSGLTGRIVSVAYIKHLVSRSQNVEQSVYKPVDFTSQYPTDLSRNVIIVTIEATNGNKYSIPDIYIENLYDDDVIFVEAYLTVRIGDMPLNTDFSFLRNQVAKEASRFSGVQVADRDVCVSISDRSKVYTYEDASIKNAQRENNIANLNSDYGRYINEVSYNNILQDKLKSVENKLLEMLT